MNPPVMLVTARRDRDGTWLLEGRCPYCHRRHVHGAGRGTTPDTPGARVPHCDARYRRRHGPPPGDYRLELAEESKKNNVQLAPQGNSADRALRKLRQLDELRDYLTNPETDQ